MKKVPRPKIQTKNIAQKSPRTIANQARGKKGGLATARNHGPKFIEARARAGGLGTLIRYGKDYFGHISRMRWAKVRRERKAKAKKPQTTR